MHIDVLPPDINESFADFTVVGDAIRFGLTTIKNFGEGIANTIIENRKQKGKFTSIADFLERITDRNLNKKSLESLIKTGAFDSLGDRSELFYNLEKLLAYNKEIAKGDSSQASLFGTEVNHGSLKLEKGQPVSTEQRLNWEKELLGLYISGNPLEPFREKMKKNAAEIATVKEKGIEGTTTTVCGIIEVVRMIRTKKNDDMAFIKISDFTDSVEVVVFPSMMQKFREVIEPGVCIAIKGKVSKRNGELSLLAEVIKRMKEN
jgi:DNA polymerase-3 subunit alpha